MNVLKFFGIKKSKPPAEIHSGYPQLKYYTLDELAVHDVDSIGFGMAKVRETHRRMLEALKQWEKEK